VNLKSVQLSWTDSRRVKQEYATFDGALPHAQLHIWTYININASHNQQFHISRVVLVPSMLD